MKCEKLKLIELTKNSYTKICIICLNVNEMNKQIYLHQFHDSQSCHPSLSQNNFQQLKLVPDYAQTFQPNNNFQIHNSKRKFF